MGHLKDIVGEGGTVHRFVTTPFMADAGLKAEVQTQWVLASDMSADAFRAKFYWVTRKDWNNRDMERKTHVVPVFERQFVEAIKVPEQSVLCILGHSDTNVAEIGGRRGPVKADGMDWWTPLQLVQWLTQGPQPLPRRMLCVKIWSCYSATNGFLAEFSRQMVRAGYRDTICVGYTAITGAMYGTPVESHPPHTKAMLAPDEKTVLGRGKDFRVIAPLPRRMPPPPDDPYAAIDIEATKALLLELDRKELPPTFLSPRLGGVKH